MSQVPSSLRLEVAAWVEDLAHDVGRYVALQSQNLPDRADASLVLECLQTDLLQTRAGPGGVFDLAAVAAPYQARWKGEFEPSLGRVEAFGVLFADIDALVAALPRVRAGELTALEAWDLVGAARRVSAGCRAVRRAAREGAGG